MYECLTVILEVLEAKNLFWKLKIGLVEELLVVIERLPFFFFSRLQKKFRRGAIVQTVRPAKLIVTTHNLQKFVSVMQNLFELFFYF